MIVRIDDFPTGVRPVLDDLDIFFKIFDCFEQNKIPFHLGIVPELLRHEVKEEYKQKLLKYNFLVPVQHGFDHRYNEMSKRLNVANDPFNRKTLGNFNEFEGNNNFQIREKIKRGRSYLSRFFGRPVEYYIPVCNVIDNNLHRILKEAGHRYIFTVTDLKYPGQIITDGYGLLAKLDNDRQYNCIGIHITWEWDYVQENGWDAWLEQFNEKIVKKLRPVKLPEPVKTEDQVIKEAPKPVPPVERLVRPKIPETPPPPPSLRPKPAIPISFIPHVANFYWNLETPVNLLRFLTLKSFRHHNPDWVMNLWVSKSNMSNLWNSKFETGDFLNKALNKHKNYMAAIPALGVNILQFKATIIENLAPNYVSDIARFKCIETGGWFFDMDQIFLRNFDDLCANDFVSGTGSDTVQYCGVLGTSPLSKVAGYMNRKQIAKLIGNQKLTKYCEIGNSFLHHLYLTAEFKKETEGEKHFLTPHNYFYPVYPSSAVDVIFNGEIEVPVAPENYALHWWGGHPKSQLFNGKYTEAFALQSKDTISNYCRKEGLL